ncbi:helix-turn-helix domain-containing protein [Cytobacillus gottheilii]|uniref:Helix-turn-helix domain-containing protein n=1 Tax=Cytobacillus gottheilii TaxID=859144 RepID=A0ABX8FG42_9BACI|nr:helix-turn-helix domain-containing protein [Cytobacillus gottheilii]QVY62977.1 helix-turn-helix domain-containing protein [Cytobacillus gottheilii]
MSEQKRALPFETTKGFAALPAAVCMYYVRHPKFNPTAERVYRYLLQRYNADYGYAWPSWNSIMRETGIGSKGTVSNALKALEHLELIKRVTHENDHGWDNNCYVFIAPIEDEGDFYRKFGEELAKKYAKKDSAQATPDMADWF